jgi:hypothetical protein
MKVITTTMISKGISMGSNIGNKPNAPTKSKIAAIPRPTVLIIFFFYFFNTINVTYVIKH